MAVSILAHVGKLKPHRDPADPPRRRANLRHGA
jgi:hypothetical protein